MSRYSAWFQHVFFFSSQNNDEKLVQWLQLKLIGFEAFLLVQNLNSLRQIVFRWWQSLIKNYKLFNYL